MWRQCLSQNAVGSVKMTEAECVFVLTEFTRRKQGRAESAKDATKTGASCRFASSSNPERELLCPRGFAKSHFFVDRDRELIAFIHLDIRVVVALRPDG